MAAPRGNQFWKIRSKHGRDKIFESPEKMIEAAEEYFNWIDTHPIKDLDFKGKDAMRVKYERMRPYTLSGFSIYCGATEKFLTSFDARLRATLGTPQEKPEDKDFLDAITYIRDIIRTQKFEGAAAGLLNPLIISRDLGLRDKDQDEDDNAPRGQTIIKKVVIKKNAK